MFAVAIVGMLALLRCARLRVEFDERAINVFPVVRTQVVEWDQIRDVTMRGSVPRLVLRDGRRISLEMLGGTRGPDPFSRSRKRNLDEFFGALDQHDVSHS